MNLEEHKGYCFQTISDKEGQVDGPQWDAMKVASLVLPADSWKEMKIYFLDQCRKSKSCSKKLPDIQKKIDRIESLALGLK